jgi:hypothetical protein
MVAVADQREHTLSEIPENRVEGLKPLDTKNHVVGALRETVAIDVEDHTMDRHLHGMAAAKTSQHVTISDSHA